MASRLEKARLFLKMMEELYPLIKSKNKKLKGELDGLMPSGFFAEVDEQLKSLKAMEEKLSAYVAHEENKKESHTQSSGEIFDIDLANIRNDK